MLSRKADDLKVKLAQKYDLLNDSEAWDYQQQLQTIYHQVLTLDLEYALDKKVEQELWALGFKNFITTLQELSRDKKVRNLVFFGCFQCFSTFLILWLCVKFDSCVHVHQP